LVNVDVIAIAAEDEASNDRKVPGETVCVRARLLERRWQV